MFFWVVRRQWEGGRTRSAGHALTLPALLVYSQGPAPRMVAARRVVCRAAVVSAGRVRRGTPCSSGAWAPTRGPEAAANAHLNMI